MKKPLILLVDDDRAVLEALEAELSPALAEICRIESFDDSRAVLDALPVWGNEGRSIAAAIVDLKMPGLDGVDLVVEMRREAGATLPASTLEAITSAPIHLRGPMPILPPESTHPASHMRAALLTGYAELDSALDAKNLAGIDRYLEKPWDSKQLLAVVRRMVSKHLRDRDAGRFLVFREIVDAGRLRDLLRLRVEVYGVIPERAHLLAERHADMDVDEFDSESAFFAIYWCGLEGETLAGGLRIVGLGTRASGDALVLALGENHELIRRARGPKTVPLGLLKFWPHPEPVHAFLAMCKGKGERVVEIGRFTIRPSGKHPSIGSLTSALAMIEGTAAVVGMIERVPNSLVSCREAHQAPYSRLGFELLPGIEPTYLQLFAAREVVLHGRADRIRSSLRKRIESQAARYDKLHHSCRCASFPDCLGGPYETGEFLAADVFCPLRAQELLVTTGTPTSEMYV